MKTIDDYQNFIFKSFHAINNLVPIKALSYSILPWSNIIAMTRPFGSIILYRRNINDYIEKFSEYGENMIKTVLLEVLAHEISHVGQKINYDVISNYSQHNIGYDDYIEFIEKTNIKNSINILLQNEYNLNNLLGFVMNHDWLIAKLDCNYYPRNYISKINCLDECFEQSLSLLFEDNNFKLYQNIIAEPGNYIRYNGQYIMDNVYLLNQLDIMTSKFNKFKIVNSNNTTLTVKIVI